MKYLFGPVNSRRLGISQGIDLVPPKICNYNCVYCEVGATSALTCERKEYIPTGELLAEIDQLFADAQLIDHLDVFTLTGSGEPTLGGRSSVQPAKQRAVSTAMANDVV